MAFVLVLLLLLAETNPTGAKRSHSTSAANSPLGCTEKERNALLKFKESLNDTSNCLSTSWVGKNCCDWPGVSCSNQTGHVTELEYWRSFKFLPEQDNRSRICEEPKYVQGELSPSLLDLEYLTYLDLRYIDFQGIPIPHFMGSMRNLRYLDLSYAKFSGMVPPTLGNLSNLFHLDLGCSFTGLWVENLHWLPNLSSLQYLNLEGVNLSKASDHWLGGAVNMLPSLLELHLHSCQLGSLPQTLPSTINFTSLSVLNLSQNSFHNSSLFLPWSFNITTLTLLDLSSSELMGPVSSHVAKQGCLCSLQTLDLSGNRFLSGEIKQLISVLSRCSNASLKVLDLSKNKLGGSLPSTLGHLKRLAYLDLSNNLFSSLVPSSLGNLSNLVSLDLSKNNLNGTIPTCIGQLSNLSRLDLKGNYWEGVVTEVHFLNLTNLAKLALSSLKNSLVFNMPHDWIPPFNLSSLKIFGCKVGPAFPTWLRTQTQLGEIVLSNTEISDKVPDWFWNFTVHINFLNLSHNKFKGIIPYSLYTGPCMVDLSFNHFEGIVPLWYGTSELILRNNLLSGPISSEIGQRMSELIFLDVSGNLLNGSIPQSLNRLKNLLVLDLSKNHLSGEIPSHWEGMQPLFEVDLSMNNLFGRIPKTLCASPSLQVLRLSGNDLSGDFSLCLQYLTQKIYRFDLGENRFSGTIPKWINERLMFISELRLRGNLLTGDIPEELCQLTELHVLDLADNDLSGSIPSCFGRLVAFQSWETHRVPQYYKRGHMELVLKGRESEYNSYQLPIVNVIDLSRNHLFGEIPPELTNLSGLDTLNLSMNLLVGRIPVNMGDLKHLETLDLSCNRLDGPIPASMPSLTFLSHLNLSHNNLSGSIPSANQFGTFQDASIYEGNPGLCGPPLSTTCSASQSPQSSKGATIDDDDDDDDEHENLWLCASTTLGFIVGFWVVCGSLVIKRSWRHSYFRFMDNAKDRLLVIIAVNMNRLRRGIEAMHQN